MLRRVIAAWVIAWFSVCAWADFGPLRVYSRLGEPLRAEISLNNIDALDTSYWRVGLANREAFDDFNFVYTPELANLRFSIHVGANGPVVVIRSPKPIHSPYLQFVLQLHTPSRSWIQGFEAMLASRGEEDVVEVPAESEVPYGVSAKRQAMHSHWVVGKKETLATLAAKIRPADVSEQQAMAALYLANRAKFVAGHPPQPRPGAQLLIPSRATMRAISHARAQTILYAGDRHAVAPPRSVAAPVAASTPMHGPLLVPSATHRQASAPTAAPPHGSSAPLAASQAAAYAASEAAARAQINTLQQQVKGRAKDLQKANQRIAELKRQLHSLQASQAAVAKMAARGFNYKSPRVWAMAGAAALLIAVLFFLLGRRLRTANGKKKKSKPLSKGALATTGVMAHLEEDEASDASEEVLAQADALLAKGQEAQAEALLKKALTQQPNRQDLRAKLLEIYALRPDPMKFEVLAREVHDAYDGRGAQWERIRSMGAGIDPNNALYGTVAVAATVGALDLPGQEAPVIAPIPAAAPHEALDFSMAEPVAVGAEPVAEAPSEDHSLLDFDFSLDNKADEAPMPDPLLMGEPDLSLLDDPVETASEGEAQTMPTTESELADLPVALSDAEAVSAIHPDAEPMAASETTLIAEPVVEMAPTAEVAVEDIDLPSVPDAETLTTKLDLAQVYLDMGDREGAREVLHELSQEAQGNLKQRAEAMLAQLG